MSVPVFFIEGETIPEVWEKAVLKTWHDGAAIKTEYDAPNDPPSRDCTMIMLIREPFGEPRIHRAFPGGLETLEAYVEEVIGGIHDHWINAEEGKWSYTYHQRLAAYSKSGGLEPAEDTVNQLKIIVDKLAAAPHTRRAQAIIWNPFSDYDNEHAPCMQRIWCRIFENRLIMNVDMRSNDAYKAAFMNIFAFTELQRQIAENLSERMRVKITPGQYLHKADSFHIYGSYFSEFEERFLKLVASRSFEERVWTTEFVEPIMAEERKRLKENPDYMLNR